MRAFLWALVAAGALVAGACDTMDEIVCTTVLVPALDVAVRDAGTGVAAAEGALGLAIDGSYVDTLKASMPDEEDGPLSLAGAYERAGTYEVVVIRPGYRTWRMRGVDVDEDECHVKTVHLEARLERE